MTQTVHNLLMDLEDADSPARVRFLIRDHDTKHPALIDEILSAAGTTTVLTGVRYPHELDQPTPMRQGRAAPDPAS